MLIVKLTTEYPQLVMGNYAPHGTTEWNGCRFLVNREVDSCDYWMVIDGLLKPETTNCPPENVLLFTGEPPTVRQYSRAFLRQFGAVVTCQRELKHPRVIASPPPLPWYMKRTYEQVVSDPITKSETLMLITSNKQMTEGHRKRYEFTLKLKDRFGDALQLYGRGIREIDDKWAVLAPSRYAVVIENSRSIDYFSEKITDCFLTETFPFYSGCPNITDYFARDAFQVIDIDNFDATAAAIERVLSDPGHFDRHRAALQQAKADYLQKYSIFALLSQQAKPVVYPKQQVMLTPEGPQFAWNGWHSRIAPLLRKVVHR